MLKEAIFAGISSGAIMRVAVRVAERKSGHVVTLLADPVAGNTSRLSWSQDYAESPEETREDMVVMWAAY